MTVAHAKLSDVLRGEAVRLIADQVPIAEIRRQTNLHNSTIRWLAFRHKLTLQTRMGPTTHTPSYWRAGLVTQKQPIDVSTPNYSAMAAGLRW